MRQVILAGLVLSCLLASGARAEGWQDTPDALQLQPMGDSLRMNGTPMVVRSFTTAMEVETVLREVRASWERHPGHAPVKRTELPNWIVLNQTVGDEHRSLQVRAKGAQAEGFVALTSPKQTRTPTLALRLPPLMSAVQVVDSVDAGKTSQQIMAVSRRSVDASASALESALKADGWKRHMLKKNGDSVVLSANRGDEQFDAILSAQKGGALLMLNAVR